MKIAIIVGSVRMNRQSSKAGIFLSGLLKNMNDDNVLLDLKDYPFPVMEERYRFLENPPEWMSIFGNHLREADGIIIVSPEYNGSYSGALKNALDYYKQEYYKKVFGVVTVSSGQWGGVNASHHLLSWVLHVKGIPSPFKLMVKHVEETFNEEGLPKDPNFTEHTEKFLNEFLWLCRSISEK